MKPAQRKPTPQTSLSKILIGKTAFSFIGAKNSDRLASPAA
jgi:hypothetical protein